jgi:hypothetical protein
LRKKERIGNTRKRRKEVEVPKWYVKTSFAMAKMSKKQNQLEKRND